MVKGAWWTAVPGVAESDTTECAHTLAHRSHFAHPACKFFPFIPREFLHLVDCGIVLKQNLLSHETSGLRNTIWEINTLFPVIEHIDYWKFLTTVNFLSLSTY